MDRGSVFSGHPKMAAIDNTVKLSGLSIKSLSFTLTSSYYKNTCVYISVKITMRLSMLLQCVPQNF